MTTTKSAPRKSLTYIRDDTEFYPHQVEGIRTLARKTNFLLADEMGLGKSLQALVTFAIDVERGWAKRLLVVAPAGLKGNWEEEIAKFTYFHYLTLPNNKPAKKRRSQIQKFADEGYHILIVNYEQVVSHIHELNALRFDMVLMDEAHYIKGPESKRTRAIQAMQANRFGLLTGSPMLNHVDDLWSLLHRIEPDEFPNYYRFRARYCVFGGYKDKQIIGVKNEAELIERLNRIMVRRLKKDVLDLPDKQIIYKYVDLHPEQRKLYKQANEELIIELPLVPDPMEIENALTKMLRLKQICGTTATMEGHPDHSSKLELLEDMVDEIVVENGEHFTVWTQFRGVLTAAEKRLRDKGINTYTLHGDVPANERTATLNQWANGEPAVLISMLQIGGVGLNMTAANKCVFLDKLYVPKLNEQAEDRHHRIGADKAQPVQIYQIIARNTIEQRIEQILARKTKTFNTVIEDQDFKAKLYKALMEEGADDE